MRPGALLFPLVAILALVALSDDDASSDETVLRNRAISAVDDAWLRATHAGADPDLWPEVRFADSLGSRIAETRCSYPRATITFSLEHLERFWPIVEAVVAPHEIAHVLVCLDGADSVLDNPHGEEWASWVRRLVPRDQAEEIISAEAL